MKEISSNAPKKIPRIKETLYKKDLSRADKVFLIQQARNFLDTLDYVTVATFANVTERLTVVFIRARGRRCTEDVLNNVLYNLCEFARRSTTDEAKWFDKWVKRLSDASPERKRSDTRDHLITQNFSEMHLEINGFGRIHTSQRGSDIYVGSETMGFFHIFEDEHDLRLFCLSLMQAATEVERFRSVGISTAIPEGYEDVAVNDISEQFIADGWLYRGRDTEDKN